MIRHNHLGHILQEDIFAEEGGKGGAVDADALVDPDGHCRVVVSNPPFVFVGRQDFFRHRFKRIF